MRDDAKKERDVDHNKVSKEMREKRGKIMHRRRRWIQVVENPRTPGNSYPKRNTGRKQLEIQDQNGEGMVEGDE